jgi:hypothetical protein
MNQQYNKVLKELMYKQMLNEMMFKINKRKHIKENYKKCLDKIVKQSSEWLVGIHAI